MANEASGNMGIKRKDLEPQSALLAIGGSSDGKAEKDARDNEVKYPSFDLTNKHIEAAGLTDVNPDDVVEFTVKARVQSVKKKSKQSKESYDSDRVELEVQNISDVTMLDQTEPEESDEDKDFEGRLGMKKSGISKGGGSMSPKTAGVKL
jgi:hypothetical protein